MAALATVLGIPANDLAALTGVDPTNGTRDPWCPAVTEVAKLIWDLRRLTRGQMREVESQAIAMSKRA
ncbi:hypothetical protein [Rugosimonospora acidiphila]|uniref:hypothetical protein n=1 Tax=Rugosimonospora acidiphila TaxID=556531 RepID=UPI0031EADEB9